jgi:hypothetical protein
MVLYLLLSFWIIFGKRGTFGGFALVVMLILFIGVPVFLISLGACVVTGLLKRESQCVPAQKGMILSIFIFALIVPYGLSLSVFDHDVKQALLFCERLIAQLDHIKQSTGEYPTDISNLLSQEKLPRFLQRNGLDYSSDGKEFTLDFAEYGMMTVQGWEYRSSRGEWVEYAD